MANRKTRRHDAEFDKSEIAALIVEKFKAYPQREFSVKQLTTSLGAQTYMRRIVQDIVYGLVDQRIIYKTGEGSYALMSDQLPSYEGVVDMLASGSMYVVVEGLEQDIFITARFGNNALNGDKVRVAVTSTRRNGSMEGQITQILERSEKNYVGNVELSHNFAFVKVDSRKMPHDIFVAQKDMGKVKDGQKVLVHVTDWPLTSKSPIGEIIDIFGQAGENNAEMHAILAEYDLPYRFEQEVEAAAEAIPETITPAEIGKRRDCRTITTFTIDPEDAKDFDDALSIRTISEGLWEVGVHIADVTHYVRPHSIVDTEGENRATSVYLVDRTVPMLPEKLSNNLCSLRPDEEKLCFSAIFEIDENAQIQNEWFGRTVIKSDRRFTYAEAQSVIETGDGDLKEEILTLNRLAQAMRAERFRNGSISFEREEAKFVLDDKGKPLGVFFKEQKESNQLIEEFMLLANKKVAEFIGRKRGRSTNTRTFVYRVHDTPNTDKLSKFSNFILRFGYYFKTDQTRDISKEMNALMAKIKGTPEENLVSTLAIRTMAKAYYSTDNIGHYGLGFKYYTHFTSPIRRYPDMMVHRLLAHYLDGGASASKEEFEKLCEHSSDMEVRAAEAERASIKYKMVEFMLERIGQEFTGTISGVTEWGFYVELDQTHIEGLVSIRELQDDYYNYVEDEYAIIGERTGRKFTLGDQVKVRMLRGDLARKQMDFQLVEVTANATEIVRKGNKTGSKGSAGRGVKGKGSGQKSKTKSRSESTSKSRSKTSSRSKRKTNE